MSGWQFRARTHDGETKRGVVQAATWDEANRVLVARKLIPEEVKPAPKDESFKLTRRPNPKAMTVFTRQFATLLQSVVPLILGLDILESLTDDKPLRESVGRVRLAVEQGQSLADAMRSHPRVFTPIFVNMVEAGEQSGALDLALLRLAEYTERSQALRNRIRGALIYPAVVLAVAVVTLLVMLLYVVPTFQGIFAAGGIELPVPTLLLVQTSEFLLANWVTVLLGVLGLVLVLRTFFGTAVGQRLLDVMMLRLPIVGPLTRKTIVARFTRTMSSMLSSGVSLLNALPPAARTANNIVLEEAMLKSQKAIESGMTVSDALSSARVLPHLVSRMIHVGEQAGGLDAMFGKVAEFYEDEVEAAVDGLLKALEPALVVLTGIILGGLVVTMYLPIFDLMTGIG